MRKLFFIAFVILLVIALVVGSGCTSNKENSKVEEKTSTKKPASQSVEKTEKSNNTVTVYFADKEAMYLWPFEYDDIDSTEERAKKVIEILFKGPAPSGYMMTVPENMSIPKVNVEDDVIVVDFLKSDIDYYPKGSTGENLFIYSIVNSLTMTTGIDKVKFTFGGESIPVPGSNYDFSKQEFEFNFDIVGKK